MVIDLRWKILPDDMCGWQLWSEISTGTVERTYLYFKWISEHLQSFLIHFFEAKFASIHLTLLVSLKYFFFLRNNGLFFPHPNVGFADIHCWTESWVRYSIKRESARLEYSFWKNMTTFSDVPLERIKKPCSINTFLPDFPEDFEKCFR